MIIDQERRITPPPHSHWMIEVCVSGYVVHEGRSDYGSISNRWACSTLQEAFDVLAKQIAPPAGLWSVVARFTEAEKALEATREKRAARALRGKARRKR